MMLYYDIICILFIGAVLTSAQQFPESTVGVELPAGNAQFHRVYASGYQHYICIMNANGSWQWVLDHPVAVLRRYDGTDVNPEVDPVVGYHEHTFTKNFTVDTAIWTLGANCNPASCGTETDKLYGTPIKKVDNKPNQALPLALFQTLPDEPHTGTTLKDATYIQRLDAVGGVVPAIVPCGPDTSNRFYNATYTAHYIFARKSSSSLANSSIYLLLLATYISIIHPLIFL